jgi:hypothetical protein
MHYLSVGKVFTGSGLHSVVVGSPIPGERSQGQWDANTFADGWGTYFVQGGMYSHKQYGPREGRLSLVLGAGNQIPVVCSDILFKLVMDDSVVICKMNPVNDYLGPILRCPPRLRGCIPVPAVRGRNVWPSLLHFLCLQECSCVLHLCCLRP